MKRGVKFLGVANKNTNRPQNTPDASANSGNTFGLQVLSTVTIVVIMLETKIESRLKKSNK